VITLALNSTHNLEWVRDFCEGLSQTIRESNCVLLGGDTVYTSGPLMVSITAFGEVESRRMVTRLNARAGDIIAITGAIGDGALGLKLRTDNTFLPNLDPESRYYLIDRYLHPQPRLNLRNALIQYASAAMDVSDGLIGDLERMIKASRDTSGLGLGARITLDAVPLSPSARIAIGYAHELHETALTGGDDYEILCTVPPQHFKAFRALVHSNALDVTPIGEMTMSGRVVCEDNKGTERTFSTPAYRHF
jgi:thiamine-monophosphate kinase